MYSGRRGGGCIYDGLLSGLSSLVRGSSGSNSKLEEVKVVGTELAEEANDAPDDWEAVAPGADELEMEAVAALLAESAPSSAQRLGNLISVV